MKITEAIDAVITYQTLPPQIDYTLPYKIKANAAQEFIKKLPQAEKEKALQTIEEQVSNYYTPAEGGGLSPAELDAMF